MKMHLAGAMVVLGMMGGMVGCSGSKSSEPAAVVRPVPADSLFAKVKMGVGEGEVTALIGEPTSVDTYQTGKAYIPFNFRGNDDVRRRAHYKGVGTITFSNDSAYTGGYSVMSVDYNPDETGYSK